MAFRDDKLQDGWVAAAVAATAGGVTATKAAATGVAYQAARFDVSSDAAALVTIESPASTILWRKRYAAAFADGGPIPQGTVQGAPGDAILIKISASTNNCEANLCGYSI